MVAVLSLQNGATVYLDTNALADYISLVRSSEEVRDKSRSLQIRFNAVKLVKALLRKKCRLFTSAYCLIELKSALFTSAVIEYMIESNIPLKYLDVVKDEKKEDKVYAEGLYKEFIDGYIRTGKIECIDTCIDSEKGPEEISKLRTSKVHLQDAIVYYSCAISSTKMDYFVSSDSKLIGSLKNYGTKIKLFTPEKFLRWARLK